MRRRAPGLALAVGLVLCASASGAGAATFTVNSPTDLHDTSPGDGLCKASSGLCTLRAAIEEADAYIDPSGPNTVVVPAGTYDLTLGTLTVSHSLTINAPAGAGATIIDAQGHSGVIQFTGSGVDSLSGVAITGGSGGGVFINGPEVTLTGLDVHGNTAQDGGGIELFGGQLTLLDSAVTGNTATGPSAPLGGGIDTGTSTNLLVESTTIADNTAVDSGDGSYGGGLNVATTGSATLNHVTLIDNQASGNAGAGGNIDLSGTLRIIDSIVAGGQATFGGDCYADPSQPIASGHNIYLGGAGNCTFAAGTVLAANPMLGVLGDNGGPGLSAEPLVGSPAIDAASGCPANGHDQRGQLAPVGPACDIGAIEVGADLQVALTQAFSQVAAGGAQTYVASVHNAGLDPAPDTVLTVTPPAGAGVVLASASTGSCVAPAVCSLGTLAPGASVTVTLVVNAPSHGPLTATASAHSAYGDPNPADDQASVTSTVTGGALPSISALKAIGRLKAGAGGKLAATLSQPATVTVTVSRLRTGRLVHGRCNAHRRAGRACVLATRIGTFATAALGGGRVGFALPAKVAGHVLSRGSYLLSAVASNATGHSKPASLKVKLS